MKTILVPTDFSSNADSALNYAIDFAKKENAKLILLNAFHVNFGNSEVPLGLIDEEVKAIRKNAETRLKALTIKIEHAGKIPYECIVKQDLAIDAILNVADEKSVDLIIMGTKGASGLKEVIMGSNTARVIELAKCPVIAIPEGLHFKEIKKITYATDYHHSDIGALKKLIEIATPFRAQINILHISLLEETDEKALMKNFMDEMNSKIDYFNLSYQIICGSDVEEQLEDYIKHNNCDLLVTSTQHRDFMDKLFGRSITKKLAFHTKVPLLAFHYKKAEHTMIL